MKLTAEQRLPIDRWRDPNRQNHTISTLRGALHLDPGQNYTVRHQFTDIEGNPVIVDRAYSAIVTVTAWKDTP